MMQWHDKRPASLRLQGKRRARITGRTLDLFVGEDLDAPRMPLTHDKCASNVIPPLAGPTSECLNDGRPECAEGSGD